MEFNINGKIKIRLTEAGKAFLLQRHYHLFRDYSPDKKPKFELPKEDKNGYSEWQMWDLIGTFGRFMEVPTMSPPFEPTIIISEKL